MMSFAKLKIDSSSVLLLIVPLAGSHRGCKHETSARVSGTAGEATWRRAAHELGTQNVTVPKVPEPGPAGQAVSGFEL